MSKFVKKPSIYASCKILFQLAKQIQRRKLFHVSENQKQESPWKHIFYLIRTKPANYVKELSQMLPVKISFIWWFQRRSWKCKSLRKDRVDRHEVMTRAHMDFGQVSELFYIFYLLILSWISFCYEKLKKIAFFVKLINFGNKKYCVLI